jgi:hypothetical protein
MQLQVIYVLLLSIRQQMTMFVGFLSDHQKTGDPFKFWVA